jgi:hypothetical protein
MTMTGTLVHVATRKGLFVVDGSGPDARIVGEHFLGDNVMLTLSDRRDGAWYAVLDHGHFGVKLHRSDDAGATWVEVAVPEYPAKPDGFVDIDMWGRDRDWALLNIWALETATDADGALWCGTSPGGLFRSDDRGESWRMVDSLWNVESRVRWNGGGSDQPAIHSICVDPRDPRQVVVAVSSGGVWRTSDGGATWSPHTTGMVVTHVPPDEAEAPENQDPHCVVQSPSDPDVFWCQHHMGIWWSDDDLRSWQPLQPADASSFGFAVAVHPHEPHTAWFVPSHSDQKRAPIDGRVIVSRTRDGGETFEVLTDGLPQRHAYDLVLRHSLDVDATGNHLTFGSTTGNLWVTANGGDRWHRVSSELPPIYSVRYV